jgi:hypothetical protein
MSWLRIDDSFDAHPKILALGSDQRRWTWVRVLVYTCRYRSGRIPLNITESVPRATPQFFRECVGLGLVDDADGTLTVHDWDAYNGSDARLLARERQRKHRDNSVTPTVTSPLPERDSRVGARARPVPIPSLEEPPSPPLSEEPRLEAWRSYAATVPGVRSVEALAKSGYQSGAWPPAAERVEKRVDPSAICTECGATLGEGHLETCPRMPKILEPWIPPDPALTTPA